MSNAIAEVRQYVEYLKSQGVTEVALSRDARAALDQLRQRKPALAPAGTSAKPSEILSVPGQTKAEKLAHLANRVRECQKCPHLASTRTQIVFGVGTAEAELMFVGEAPGADEDKAGEPFVGLAGQLLTKMIAAMGLTREQVYIANILKCRPDMPKGSSGNRKPTLDEMETCSPFVTAQIEIIKPKVMVALGATAVEGLLGVKTPISRLRGSFLDFRGIPVMPTFHPAYLLRNASNLEKRKVWEDLLQVMEKLDMRITEKQRNYFKSAG